MKNLLIHAPEMQIITSEGTGRLYEELDSYLDQDKQTLPTVFDVLNCEYGCNGGPAVGGDSSKASVGSAKENDEGIHVAINDVNMVVDKFDTIIEGLLLSVEEAIAGANQTSENSQHIKDSMEKVSNIAEKVQEVIHETNRILNHHNTGMVL